MSLKGISPVIASVILIAITLAIAGMLSIWATSFMSAQQSQFEQKLQCTDALEIDRRAPSLTYNTETQTLNIIVRNKGTVKIDSLKAIVTYPSGSVENYNTAISLNPGDGNLIPLVNNTEKPLRVLFFTDQCSSLGEVAVP